MAGLASSLLGNPYVVFPAAVLLRVGLLLYGNWQDANSAMKYTDIDYFVFTDAARYVARGLSPYLRDTYRYTPLLAWLLVPTSWAGAWFSFGKALFAVGDLVTGWLMIAILQRTQRMSVGRATKYSCLWLLNPMVATISTRGSSEGLLAVIVMALLWAATEKRIELAGFLLGFGVHFKIYPFIYAVSIAWWLDPAPSTASVQDFFRSAHKLITPARLSLAACSGITFIALNALMFSIYGHPFLEHTFFYHLIRTDHRHNFSPYNLMLYQQSADSSQSSYHPERFVFIPQLLLSAVLLPLLLARKDLPSTMLAQTLGFVTFNKVCTSQYFLWYMVLLPFYLPNSTLLRKPVVGSVALLLWVVGQGLWLSEGFKLEFLGQNSWIPGLWGSSLAFYLVNVWIMGIVITDIRESALDTTAASAKKSK